MWALLWGPQIRCSESLRPARCTLTELKLNKTRDRLAVGFTARCDAFAEKQIP